MGWGVWSPATGGFVDGDRFSWEADAQAVADDDSDVQGLAGDLRLYAVEECEFHPDQSAEDCDECRDEED